MPCRGIAVSRFRSQFTPLHPWSPSFRSQFTPSQARVSGANCDRKVLTSGDAATSASERGTCGQLARDPTGQCHHRAHAKASRTAGQHGRVLHRAAGVGRGGHRRAATAVRPPDPVPRSPLGTAARARRCRGVSGCTAEFRPVLASGTRTSSAGDAICATARAAPVSESRERCCSARRAVAADHRRARSRGR